MAGRVLAATMGAYAVTAGSAALIAAVLAPSAHLSRSDALIVGSAIGYLLFAFLMLWAFVERRLMVVWIVLITAALATHGAAMLLAPVPPSTGRAP